MDNQTRRILLERVKASGFPGSILDVFQNPTILDQFIAEQQQSQLQQPQNQPVVAQTPQEQEQGLRPAHAAGNVGQSMIFPNVEPNQSFNTVGMKIPIDINKVDNQGNLVESYKSVPPGIQDLPTGPNRGMVIESPAEGYAKTGGIRKYQTGRFKYQAGSEAAADATAVKVNPLVRVINIDEPLPNIDKPLSNFDYQDYYDKANKYLSRDIFKGTTLTAKDIADAANEFYTESNYQYPLDLLLTQAQIESKLGKQLKSKHNYFNVGNTDSGATRDFASAKDSVKDYINLMYNDYLNKGQKSVDELLKPKGFVNHQGNRYASNPDYENMLSSQMQFINNYLKNHKTGGVRKYQTAGPVKTVESYRSPWWDPSDPTKWNKAWTIDPERQRTQAEFPNGYTLPTIEITGEKLKNSETSNKKISTDPTYIFPPADRSEAKYDEFMDKIYEMSEDDTKFNNINFGQDTIINITNTPMGWFGFNTIPGETYTSILGNNYIEKADNNTGKPEDTAGNWKTRIKDPNDTFRNADGAKHSGSYYHSKDIPAFYGIEDKKFKVGKPEDFNENTMIVPVRNSTVPYAKVDVEDGLFNREHLYTYDADGNKIWNLSNKDKFIVYSPVTGQTIFLSSSRKRESGKFMKTALEKFKEDNPDAYIISIDEGRFGSSLHSSEGLPENAFEYWNSRGDRTRESRRIIYPWVIGDKTNYPIDNDTNPDNFGYNIGILKEKTGGVRTYLKGGLKNRVLYNKARYKR